MPLVVPFVIAVAAGIGGVDRTCRSAGQLRPQTVVVTFGW